LWDTRWHLPLGIDAWFLPNLLGISHEQAFLSLSGYRVMLIALAFGKPAQAYTVPIFPIDDSLSLFVGADAGTGPVSHNQPISDSNLTESLTGGVNVHSPSASAMDLGIATYGDLGLQYSAVGFFNLLNCQDQCEGTVSGEVLLRSYDTLYAPGADADDFIRIRAFLQGGVRLNASELAGLGGGDAITYFLFSSGRPFSYGAQCQPTATSSNCGSAINLDLDKFVYLPLNSSLPGGPVYTFIDQRLDGTFACNYDTTIPCSLLGSIFDSALVGDATVVDANGNVVPGTTILSSSGHDYTQPLQESTVPEPASGNLLLMGLVCVLCAVKIAKCREVQAFDKRRSRKTKAPIPSIL
jgi:hypothetical protein